MIKTLTILTYLFAGAEPHQLPMELRSTVLGTRGGEIPVSYTCRGRDVSIPLEWRHVPAGTRSLALVMLDKTPPKKYLWAIYNIPPQQRWVESAAKLFRGEQYAKNSWGHLRYDGPCPSQNEHRYVITLYALKAHFYFDKKITTAELLEAMQHRIITTAKIETRFGVSKKTPHLNLGANPNRASPRG